jgi:dTDP-4-amino-4,6-dideoxygalactose transaminase
VIPFLDLRPAYLELRSEIDEAIQRVLSSSQFVLAEEVDRFESDFAAYVGAAHCIGVGSGYDAILLALMAAGIGRGDEVIVPANTYIATWLAVSGVGAVVVPVEPDVETMNISIGSIAPAVTSKTRAVIPVHLYGYPVELDPILKFCRERGLSVIEDAAQAHGASIAGKRIGGHSDAVAWSFYPSKNLGAFGDGGAVTTQQPELAERLQELRNYGSSVKHVHRVQGLNSRLDELQAAILGVKLKHLDAWNARRADRAEQYLRGLSQTDLCLPPKEKGVTPAWHLFVVRHHHRDALCERLLKEEIVTQVHYPTPPHLQPAYRGLGLSRGSFPVSEALHDSVLSLPMGPHLTNEDLDHVIAATKRIVSELSD